MRPDSDFRCYDAGDKYADRYTIVPARKHHRSMMHRGRNGNLWQALASSGNPFHPQGFGQHVEVAVGPHLGKRVALSTLPVDTQRFAQTGLFD